MLDLKKEKLINAVIYFLKHTKHCGKMKLFKLLYFLDFLHFKRYGTTVTGLKYFAWKWGPVPVKLYEELSASEGKNYLQKDVTVVRENDEYDPGFYEFKLYPKHAFDKQVFSANEMKILEEVVYIYKDATATEMSEITHLKNTPWDKTIKEKGLHHLIDYELAIDDETPLTLEEIRERYALEKEFEGK